MMPPGMVLSQPTRTTRASKRFPRVTSSMESAMTSRLISEAFMPSVPMVMPSEMETVLNSSGVPPASRMPSLTCVGEFAKVKVAGADFDPGIGDADERLREIFIAEGRRREAWTAHQRGWRLQLRLYYAAADFHCSLLIPLRNFACAKTRAPTYRSRILTTKKSGHHLLDDGPSLSELRRYATLIQIGRRLRRPNQCGQFRLRRMRENARDSPIDASSWRCESYGCSGEAGPLRAARLASSGFAKAAPKPVRHVN